jgi:formylglycine-generating enzyme required for sulfatase activity
MLSAGAMNRTALLLCFATTGLGLASVGAVFLPHGRAAAATPAAKPTEAVNASACQDADGDGYGLGCARGPDCNDQDAKIHPGAAEACNQRDDDCNGLVDDAASCTSPAIDPRARVLVTAGAFMMGSEHGAADEKPVHRVSGSAFEMDRFEVTNGRYRACVDSGKCAPPKMRESHRRANYFGDPAFDDYPVIFVDHGQAETFCRAEGGKLPTEAEWERAARGTDTPRTFPWGDKAPDCSLANMGGPQSCVGDTDRVGRRPEGASPYGAMDMAGNVWEWTSDWYDAKTYSKPASDNARDPKGPAEGKLKVMRGGCWVSGADSLRTTCRKAELPATWAYNVGFRCVYPAPPGSAREGGAR